MNDQQVAVGLFLLFLGILLTVAIWADGDDENQGPWGQ